MSEIDPQVSKALGNLRNANEADSWVLMSYVKDARSLFFAASGQGDINEITEYLDQSKVQFALIRRRNDEGATKDIFVSFVGPDVGFTQRRHVSECRTEANSILGPVDAHCNINPNDNLGKKLSQF
ncbi:hypothetical protein N7478_006418 [Penicillium angulare]|uniref:uncharacterized protein n=1 Tax=Penicillium angulare TaxID=116970 RepID=UPI00254148B9|nr:uncharacterized protein N7478_006418 [Penicillium angulare]KAJ5281046.1 hypothetical protein N7478_006418 [Penicillium angulare]